jgi:hypothetical protein
MVKVSTFDWERKCCATCVFVTTDRLGNKVCSFTFRPVNKSEGYERCLYCGGMKYQAVKYPKR